MFKRKKKNSHPLADYGYEYFPLVIEKTAPSNTTYHVGGTFNEPENTYRSTRVTMRLRWFDGPVFFERSYLLYQDDKDLKFLQNQELQRVRGLPSKILKDTDGVVEYQIKPDFAAELFKAFGFREHD